jgi:hypothetical protein
VKVLLQLVELLCSCCHVRDVTSLRSSVVQKEAELRLLQAKRGAQKRAFESDIIEAGPSKTATKPTGKRQLTLDDSDDDF